MRCPKCDHDQRDTNECEACGLIFSRYRVVQERKKEVAEKKAVVADRKSGTAVKFLQIIVLVTVVASATYYLAPVKKGGQPQQPAVESVAVKQNTPAPQRVKTVESAQQTTVTSSTAVPRRNGIELARKATVSIETPWGTGSGFFVNEYYIVTNRHVIELDQSKVAEFRKKIETARSLIDLEKQKLRDMRAELQKLARGPSRSQLALIIEARQNELNKILPQQEEGEERLEQLERDLQPSDIKIILADDSKHVANYVLVSDKYDLALMSLFSGEYPFLSRPPAGKKLQQGEKVYTVGSPVGLRHTVTAGVFSGYRKRDSDDQVFLQTDAAINPGNSGGPLIDEHGFVYGVNTMILRDTEGIGFAIPVEKVFEEFDSTLY
jgi:serine protease Do